MLVQLIYGEFNITPEITYAKMISLIHFRRDRLLEKKAFIDQMEIDSHVKNYRR